MALYDRFLLRFVVDYIAEDFRFLRMLETSPQAEKTTITLEELSAMQAQVRDITIPDYIYRTIADIRRELRKKPIQASDRRYRQSLSLLQAHAYLTGGDRVTEKDLFVLEHALWRDPGERPEVHSTIHELVFGYEAEVNELLYQSREIREYALRPWETSEMRAHALIEVHTKLRNILLKVEQIMEKAKKLGRPLDKVGAIKEEIEEMQQQMLERF
jgi:MoxR-like ATPase